MTATLFDLSDCVDSWSALRDISGPYWWSGWRQIGDRQIAIQLSKDVIGWTVMLLRVSPGYTRRVFARNVSWSSQTRTWYFPSERPARQFCNRLWARIDHVEREDVA